jgi:hypothetical protein
MKTQAKKPGSALVPQAKPALKIPKILLEGDETVALPATPEIHKHLPPPLVSKSAKPVEPTLPQSYGTGKLLLTVRDPHWLYAHWDLSPQQKASTKRTLMVRVFPQDEPQQPASESTVHADTQHCFIHVPRAGTTYNAELGYVTPSRDWVGIARSNSVALPPDAPSAEKTALFATLNSSQVAESRPPMIGRTAPIREPAQPAAITTPVAEPKPSEFAAKLNESVVRVTPGLLERIVGRKQTPISPPPSKRNVFPSHSPHLVETEAPDWTEGQEHALLLELARFQSPLESMSSGAVMELLGMQAVVPSSIESVSSALEGKPQPRGFWLNLNAELLIYGVTEPDALLTLGGYPIELRPDGTFTCRFALPDGDYELPVLASSKNGELRLVLIRVSRKTEKQDDVGTHPQAPSLKPPIPGL